MFEMKAITPVKPVAAYVGGKSRLAGTIIPYIEAIPHNAYCEPFVGMGGIFFRRKAQPKTEVINDYNGEIANLFRILCHHYDPFIDLIAWKLSSREEYGRLIDTKPETLTDLQRAARFFYLQRLAFGGRIDGKNFGMSAKGTAYFNTYKAQPLLYAVHKRLSGVVIEHMDYKEFITRYDREGTLFYLDPPYYGSEHTYGRHLFTCEEFTLMAELLQHLKGTFILSLNNHPEVTRLFRDFYQFPVATTYSIMSKDDPRSISELLISNVCLDTFIASS